MSLAPPDGWTIDGEWGIDADLDDSVTMSGMSSLKLLSTKTPTVYSVWFPVNGVPMSSTDVVALSCYIVGKSDNAGNNVTVTLYVYEADRVTGVDAKIVYDGPVSSSGWSYKGKVVEIDNTDNAARWAHIIISKTSTGNVWIDRVSVNEVAPYAQISRATDQSISANATLVVDFNAIDFEARCVADLTNNRIEILEPGIYVCSAVAEIEDPVAGARVAVIINNSGTAALGVTSSCSWAITTATDAESPHHAEIQVTDFTRCNAGDYISMSVVNHANATQTISYTMLKVTKTG